VLRHVLTDRNEVNGNDRSVVFHEPYEATQTEDFISLYFTKRKKRVQFIHSVWMFRVKMLQLFCLVSAFPPINNDFYARKQLLL